MTHDVATVLVDGRPVAHPTAGGRGIGRYVLGLLDGLVRVGAPVIALYATDDERAILAEVVPDDRLERWSPSTIARHTHTGTWYVATGLMLHPIPFDPVPSIVTESGIPVAAVMYDVIPYRYPDHYLSGPHARVQAEVRAVLTRTLDAMLSISDFSGTTASDELRFPMERTRTIGAGYDERFRPATEPVRPLLERVLPPAVDRWVVSVTGIDERKNTEGLIRAWALVPESARDGHHLVIANSHTPAWLARWTACVRDAGVESSVIITGSVTDAELVALFQGARLSLMPSFDEGFGLPVLEAAACGCPVICSNTSALPEILCEPAALFDPSSDASIAAAIERALVDDDHRAVLVSAAARAAARWTWPRVGADTVAALAQLGQRWHRTLREPHGGVGLAAPEVVDRLPADVVGRYVKPWDLVEAATPAAIDPD
ncbi:MAG: glycosyltransferase family 4 protein [Ilumatobacteraceae bacterium]